MRGSHFEPFVHLADLAHDGALVAWGGFYFDPPATDGDSVGIVEDHELGEVPGQAHRSETIGAASPPYGHAVVEARDATTGAVAARAETAERNHAWLGGLAPDTEYTYRVVVDGEPWGDRVTYDWVQRGDRAELVATDRGYDLRFRTFPAPGASAPLRFAVLGDYGVGILASEGKGARQLRLAEALDRAVRATDVRLVLTTGDNVYLGEEDTVAGTGDEDDDWYFSFYQPYRYTIARVPVFPGVGNHDTGESEVSDNRDQLADNLFTELRFGGMVESRRASVDPGLFYRFAYGADVEFVCVDTTEAHELDDYRWFFEHPRHRDFLERSLPEATEDDDGPMWRIPFTHHPPFCAGPHHHDLEPLAEVLVPLLHRAGIRLVLSGHEHNFQHHRRDAIDYVVSGAAGKLRPEPPDRCVEVGNVSWAAEGHFLLVDVDRDRIVIHPVTDVAEDGSLTHLVRVDADGNSVRGPVVIERRTTAVS